MWSCLVFIYRSSTHPHNQHPQYSGRRGIRVLKQSLHTITHKSVFLKNIQISHRLKVGIFIIDPPSLIAIDKLWRTCRIQFRCQHIWTLFQVSPPSCVCSNHSEGFWVVVPPISSSYCFKTWLHVALRSSSLSYKGIRTEELLLNLVKVTQYLRYCKRSECKHHKKGTNIFSYQLYIYKKI